MALQAGLQGGDVILGINNQAITSVRQFRKLLDAAGNFLRAAGPARWQPDLRRRTRAEPPMPQAPLWAH